MTPNRPNRPNLRTNQELYSTVRQHLLSQGRKSVRFTADGTTSCAYRGWDGTKCAIGCLIPDSSYQPYMEGESIKISYMLEVIGIYDNSEGASRLPAILQALHDHLEPSEWELALNKIAREFALEA